MRRPESSPDDDSYRPIKQGRPRRCVGAFAQLIGLQVSLLLCVGIALTAQHHSDTSCSTR